MDITKVLDTAIRNYEMKNDSTIQFGYTTKTSNVPYDLYVSNKNWDDFKKKMKSNYIEAFSQFSVGDGDELSERKVKAHIYPPKMAAFGSSSRMLFYLAKDIPNFEFEKKLPTTVGGTANLDGFKEYDDSYIFIEAKCHEPYSSKSYRIGTKYKKLYTFLTKNNTTPLRCDIINENLKDKDMKVNFSYDSNQITNYDIKQMISHLCGIATALLNDKLETKPVHFVYLMFNPCNLQIENELDKNKIFEIYDKTYIECKSIDYKTIFKLILEFLQEHFIKTKKNYIPKDLNLIIKDFNFTLCSQNNFKNIVK